MEDFSAAINEYRLQLEKGAIQKAYRGLMAYMLELRKHFNNQFPGVQVPGNLYFGYMDMTYFSVVPESLARRKLKIAIVFLHEGFRFEAWLSGQNRQVQDDYRRHLQQSGQDQYHLIAKTENPDAIIERILVNDPDFRDLNALTQQIESGTRKFIAEMEDLLAAQAEAPKSRR